MTYKVTIRQFETPIDVEMGQTVLEAALAQGVPYPHGCRSGNCGACKSRLYSGDVDLAPHSEYALTDEERANGLVLACRSVPWEDIEIGWLDEGETVAHPIRRMACTVAEKEAMTHDIVRVRLDIVSGGPFTFSAGQYAEVTFAGMPARDYSMANRPDEQPLEFHIRRVPGGTVSGHAFDTLRAGDEVRVEGPYGSAWLRESHRGPILALAGGSGLAPVKSIVGQALATDMEQDIRLYFGVRDARDLYLTAHFEALAAAHPNLTFVPVLSAPSGETAYRTGLLHEAVAADVTDADGMKAYIAGPPPMVEAASALLEGCDIRREDIHADAFYTEVEKAELEKPR
jgi:ferredoxin-NAD(P)+ reductase (naphthalene dioxygenase ferredoxin-specific)